VVQTDVMGDFTTSVRTS